MIPIPGDLRDYLSVSSNRTLTFDDGEIRKVTLFAPEKLQLCTFDVDTYQFHLDGEFEQDPEKLYKFEGVDLVQSCEGYSPNGVLIWFPALQAYGSWDCDHHTILLYPDVTWTQIMMKPVLYFNGQWYPEQVAGEYLRPWKK